MTLLPGAVLPFLALPLHVPGALGAYILSPWLNLSERAFGFLKGERHRHFETHKSQPRHAVDSAGDVPLMVATNSAPLDDPNFSFFPPPLGTCHISWGLPSSPKTVLNAGQTAQASPFLPGRTAWNSSKPYPVTITRVRSAPTVTENSWLWPERWADSEKAGAELQVGTLRSPGRAARAQSYTTGPTSRRSDEEAGRQICPRADAGGGSEPGGRPPWGAPAHVPTHAPAYGGGQGSRAGGGPARGGAGRVNSSSLPSPLPSPLPPPPPQECSATRWAVATGNDPSLPLEPLFFTYPLCFCPGLLGGRGRVVWPAGPRGTRQAWSRGFIWELWAGFRGWHCPISCRWGELLSVLRWGGPVKCRTQTTCQPHPGRSREEEA